MVMTFVEWSKDVNTKFYNYSEEYVNHSTSTEYESGRKAVILKNTRFIKKKKCSLSLDVINGEYENFWTWYKDTLGGLAGVFTCKALGTGYYRFSSVPNASEGLIYRTIELELEEVY